MNDLIDKQNTIKIIKNADVFVAYHEKDPIEEAVDRAIRATKRSIIYDIENLSSAENQKEGKSFLREKVKRASMCNHELKRLYYTSDDDYDIQSCRVELEEKLDKYTLSYCEKCGQVFVMEIAEKRMNHRRNLHLSTARSGNITVMREDEKND